MVYSMKHPVLWTVMVWAIAVVGYVMMCMTGEDHVPVAFVYLSCIAFVGAMPLIKGDHNTMHWLFGITGCAASQLWCVLQCAAADSITPLCSVVTLWALYLVIMLCARMRHWCFWMEVWCMAAVIMTAWMTGGPGS